MKYDILLLGRTKDSFLAKGEAEYLKRLRHYSTVALKIVKAKNLQGSDRIVKEKEGQLLRAQLDPKALLVALDEHGRQFTSPQFAALVSDWEGRGVKKVNFVIGGPFGLDESILRDADMKISLSKMTFTHDMVRLFLLEQLYRAYTIKAGEKYHK